MANDLVPTAGSTGLAPDDQPQSPTLSPAEASVSGAGGPQLPLNNASSATNPDGSQNEANTDWHSSNHFKNFFAPLVNMAGKNPTASVDDDGNLIKGVTQATPGTLFKNLLAGSLTGLAAAAKHPGLGFGGGMGVGAGAEMEKNEEDKARVDNAAVQKFQIKKAAQKAADEHATAVSEDQERAAQIAYHNAARINLTYDAMQKSQEYQDNLFKQEQGNRDYILKNGGTISKQDVSGEEAQKLVASDHSTTHTLQFYLVGEKPMLDDDGKEVMAPKLNIYGKPMLDESGQQIMAPKMQYRYDVVQSPDDHQLTKDDIKRYKKADISDFDQGTVKPGQTISGSRWIHWENELHENEVTDLQKKEYQASIAAKNSEVQRNSLEGQKLTSEIKDQKDRKQTQDDYTAALQKAQGDPDKANNFFWQDSPVSASRMYAAQEQYIASQPETETTTDATGQEKTVQKVAHRLITPPGLAEALVAKSVDALKGMDFATVKDTLGKSSKLTDAQKQQVMQKLFPNGAPAAQTAQNDFIPYKNVPSTPKAQ